MTSKIAFWAAFYSGIGGFVLLLTGGLWNEGMLELGAKSSSNLSVTDSLICGVACLLVLTIGLSIVNNIMLARKKNPFCISVVNAAVTLSAYYTTAVVSYMIGNPVTVAVFYAFWALIFGFIIGGLIAWSIYLNLSLSKKKERKFRDPVLAAEVLKTEHSWFLSTFTSVSYASLIFVVSAVLVSWTQMILPSLPSPASSGVGIFKLYFTTSIQLVYAGVGLWFGIVGKLLGYSLYIHEELLKLARKKPRRHKQGFSSGP